VTPETAHVIGQEIRHQRGLLTASERWVRATSGEPREGLDRISFWRDVMAYAERRLAKVVVDRPVEETRRLAWR
jgi:hypothetical protein